MIKYHPENHTESGRSNPYDWILATVIGVFFGILIGDGFTTCTHEDTPDYVDE